MRQPPLAPARPPLRRLALSAALALLGAEAAAQAQPALNLPPVELRGAPLVEDLGLDDFASASATVGREQVRDQQALDLAAALRRTPGVQIARYNPVGAFGGDQGGAVFVRGLGLSRPGSELRTSIDGLPFQMGVWNHPLLDLLPLHGMRSITVFKSPQVHRFGDAFAQIDLQPERPTEDGLHGRASLAGGRFQTVQQQALLSGRNESGDFTLVQGHAESDGHRRGADGRLDHLMARGAWKLHRDWELDGLLLHVDTRAGDPGDARQPEAASPPRYLTRATLAGLGLRHSHGRLSGRWQVYTSQGDGDWLDQAAMDGGLYDTRTRFESRGLRGRETLQAWEGGSLTLGLDHDETEGRIRDRTLANPQGQIDTPTFRLTSPYLGLSHSQALGGGWSLQPSLAWRFYDHSVYGREDAPQLGLALQSEDLTLYANLARGVHHPGLETVALSGYIPPLAGSREAIAPETLAHAEVGAKLALPGGGRLDLALFRDTVRDRIVFGFPPDVPPPPQFLNLGRTTLEGLELAWRQPLGAGWQASLGLTLLDPDLDTLPYTPRRALSLGLNGQAGPLRLAFDLQAQSSMRALNRARVVGVANTEQVGGFAVAHGRLALPLPALGRQGEVFLAVDNLFDRAYAYRPGYPMAGRSGLLGVAASF